MRELNADAYAATVGGPADAAPAATAAKLTPVAGLPAGSLDGPSPYSSWRYASARESSDSDGAPLRRSSPPGSIGGAGSGAAAEYSWRAAGAALAARQESQSPAALAMGSPIDSAQSAGADGGDTAATRQQLWSPSKRAHVAAPAGGALQPAAPPGLDAASYAAGERAAFMVAFQQALPGQQALGQLFTGGGRAATHRARLGAACPPLPCFLPGLVPCAAGAGARCTLPS